MNLVTCPLDAFARAVGGAPSLLAPTERFDMQTNGDQPCLHEAFSQHRAALEKPVDLKGAPSWLVDFYDAHDAVHALLGLSTRGRHEILVDAWSLWATDLSFAEYRRAMTHPVTWRLIRATPLSAALSMLVGLLLLPWLGLRLVLLRRRPKWRFHAWRELEGRPISLLRETYRVPRPLSGWTSRRHGR